MLVVEDGTGLPNAESYASVTSLQTYATNRGIVLTGFADDTAIEQALRKSTDYMEGAYRLAWKGTRIGAIQALCWPRYNVLLTDMPGGYGSYPYIVPPNTVPTGVVVACIVLAIQTLCGDLAPVLDRKTLMEKVDVIEVQYDPNAPVYKQYRSVDGLLAMYIANANGETTDLARC